MLARQIQQNCRYLNQLTTQNGKALKRVPQNLQKYVKINDFRTNFLSTSCVLQKVKGIKPKGLSKDQLATSKSKSSRINTALRNLHNAVQSGAKPGDSLYASSLNACKAAGCTSNSINTVIERIKEEKPSHVIPVTGSNEIAFLAILKAKDYGTAFKGVKAATRESLGSFQCIEVHRTEQIFEKKGKISILMQDQEEEKATELAIEIGAEDVEIKDNVAEFTCDSVETHKVISALKENNIEVEDWKVGYFPLYEAQLSESDKLPFKFVVTALKQNSIKSKTFLDQIITNFEHDNEI